MACRPRGVKIAAVLREKLSKNAGLTNIQPSLRHTEEVQTSGREEIL